MKEIFKKYEKEFTEAHIELLKILNKPYTTWKEKNPKAAEGMDLTDPIKHIYLRKDIIEFFPALKDVDVFELILRDLQQKGLVTRDSTFLYGIPISENELKWYEADPEKDPIHSRQLLTNFGKECLASLEKKK